MKFLTGLLYCLLALSGCDSRPSTTSITRASENGIETIFSKTTVVEGVATFQCYTSRSGGCHYRIYEQACGGPPASAAAAPGTASAPAPDAAGCRQRTLDSFVLGEGRSRRIEGLPVAFGHCVTPDPAAGCG